MTKEQETELMILWVQGHSVLEAAKIVGVNPNTAYAYMRRKVGKLVEKGYKAKLYPDDTGKSPQETV